MLDRIDSKSHVAVQFWPIFALCVYMRIFFAWHGFRKIVDLNDGLSSKPWFLR